MKEMVCTFIGAIAAAIAAAFGGWTPALTTLIVLMFADYITGFMVAAIFKRSPKSELGGVASTVGFMGLCKKFVILFFVLVAVRLDGVMGTTYLKDVVCIAYIINELVSLIENAGLMGVPIPAPIVSAIDILKQRSGE
ncbi:MAG: phage holin family protein [Treponema sp.]|nr:phage holin family protein [Candidatus Treponema caballi]